MKKIFLTGLFLFCCGWTTVIVSGAQVITITENDAAVLSGPGADFYLTSFLHSGDTAEVYDEKNGYLAIRPPLGSFSWVSAKYVKLGTNNLGTITAEGLASLVGSELTDECSTVQVKLHKGETIFVLGKRTTSNAENPFWYKIAPPSGEFRWIAKIAASPIRQVSGETKAENKKLKVNDEQLDTGISTIDNQLSTILDVPKPLNRPEQIPLLSEPIDAFHQALKELEKDTITVMKQPADDAVFAMLIKQGEELGRTAKTDKDLEKIFNIVETLKRTRMIRQEKGMMNGKLILEGGRLKAGNSQLSTLNSQAKFDITGKLGGFDPCPKGHPPYALVNSSGQIVCLVSPDGSIDLEKYVGKQIGVNGILGYYEKPNQPKAKHITAKDIKEL